MQFVKGMDIAEELTEDTFVALAVKRPLFRENAKFRTWLFTIARNKALNYLHSAAFRRNVPIDEAEEVFLPGSPEQRLLAEHLRDLLAEGKEFDEICEEMLRYHKHTHLLFSLESLANLARNGRVKPAVAAVARMLGIRVIGQASEIGELDVLCKTRGEHGALERIVLELKEHGYTNGRLHISHCGNPAAAERLKHMVKAVFDGAKVDISECGGLCSYYAELGGLLVGYEDAEA